MSSRLHHTPRSTRSFSTLAVLAAVALTACARPAEPKPASTELTAAAADSLVEKHLVVFDTLDFDVFSNQKWNRLSESHSDSIIVTWPDGHDTKGLDAHIADLKAMFSYAPDSRVSEHPVRFGQHEWTSVQGILTGTFTKPMQVGPGTFVQPTNKPFKVTMVTVGHWVNGKMDHEWLFWDNMSFMRQVGLAQ